MTAARPLHAVPVDGGTTVEQWEPPLPLGMARALPAFPVDALPGWVADEVTAVAEFTQTPPDLPACIALSALSTAIAGRTTVRIRPGWDQPTNLFTLVALPPGSRKSDVFRELVRPLYTAQDELLQQAIPQIEEAKIARRAAEREADDAEKNAHTTDPLSIAEATEAALKARTIPVPAEPRLIVDDITPETATTMLAEQGGRLAVLAPEGGIVAIIAGRYSGVPNFELFLRGHAAERLEVNRRGREERIDHATLTLGLVVQPQTIRDLATVPYARERGLLARFLYSLPRNTVGQRATNTPPVPVEVTTTYDRHLRSLVRTYIDQSDPVILQFGPDANAAMLDLQTEIEPKLHPDTGTWARITDWASKYAGTTARIAGIIHTAHHPHNPDQHPITDTTFNHAQQIGNYFLAHAFAAYDLMATDSDLDAARTVLTWIERTRPTTFTKRELFTGISRGRFKKVAELEPALALLEEHGHLRQAPTPERAPGKRGRAPSPSYWTHPTYRQEPTQ